MPLFDYTASDRSGVLARGQLESSDRHSAGQELTMAGLFVLEIKPVATPPAREADPPPSASLSTPEPEDPSLGEELSVQPTWKQTASWSDDSDLMDKTVAVDPPKRTARDWLPRRTWSRMSRALYLRQLQIMFRAGIPLYRSAAVLAEGQEYDVRIHNKLSDIPRDLERGRLLSKALERTALFNPLIVSSVRLGEESGRLDSILEALSDNEERGVRLTRALISRLTYPFVVLVSMSCGLMILGHIMSRVMSDIPSLKDSLNPAIEFFTQMFQSRGFLPGLLISLVLLALLARKLWCHENLRMGVERLAMRWPIVGPLIRRLEANTVTSHLALLLKAGLPLDRGLKLCSELVHTLTWRTVLLTSQQELHQGMDLGESFLKAEIFPEDVLALIQAGEISGSLEQSLNRAAKYCAEQVERTLETALAIIEPLLVAFLGIAIGAVLILTFVPIFSTLKDL